jgi:hypothetical protein
MIKSIRALIKTNAKSSNGKNVPAPHFSLVKSLGNKMHAVKNSAPSRNVAKHEAE